MLIGFTDLYQTRAPATRDYSAFEVSLSAAEVGWEIC